MLASGHGIGQATEHPGSRDLPDLRQFGPHLGEHLPEQGALRLRQARPAF